MASAFQYQWNNYLKSGGSKLVELFQDILMVTQQSLVSLIIK